MSENINYLFPRRYAEVVLRLSEKIAELADVHDWESARKLEEQRQQALEELFAHPDIDQALPSISPILLKVMQLDAEVIIQGETELEHMAVQLGELGKGKRAVNAYLKT